MDQERGGRDRWGFSFTFSLNSYAFEMQSNYESLTASNKTNEEGAPNEREGGGYDKRLVHTIHVQNSA